MRHPLSFSPKLKKPNPPKFQKAISPQKAAVKSAAMPKNSPSKAKHGVPVPTKKPKAPRPKTPAKPKSLKKGKPKKEVKSAVVKLRLPTALFRANTLYAKDDNLSKPVLLDFQFLAEPKPVFCSA